MSLDPGGEVGVLLSSTVRRMSPGRPPILPRGLGLLGGSGRGRRRRGDTAIEVTKVGPTRQEGGPLGP